jgi:hypothetical protein
LTQLFAASLPKTSEIAISLIRSVKQSLEAEIAGSANWKFNVAGSSPKIPLEKRAE